MPELVSRRGLLLRLALAVNGVAAALLAIPILGYLGAPLRRLAEQAWIPLGPLTQFPPGQTRLATYRNPFVQPWDGETARFSASRSVCWTTASRWCRRLPWGA